MAVVPLTQGRSTLVDDADLELVSRHRWKVLKAGGVKEYACRGVSGHGKRPDQTLLLHRVLTGAARGQVVDHINNNGLDNRRANLRVGTQSENLGNQVKTRGKSKYKGVYWNTEKGLWQAQIKGEGRARYLGRFANEDDAARAYNDAAAAQWGTAARLNVIGGAE